MAEKKKCKGNNQWASLPVEQHYTGAEHKPNKTAGNNQWTSTNKNPMD